jgi:hypothetical protein
MPAKRWTTVLLLFALTISASADELATEQAAVEQASSLQFEKIQATLQAKIANAKEESNRELLQARQDKENKLSLLNQVQQLEQEKKQALDHAASLEKQLGLTEALQKKTAADYELAETTIEQQKKTISLLEEKE